MIKNVYLCDCPKCGEEIEKPRTVRFQFSVDNFATQSKIISEFPNLLQGTSTDRAAIQTCPMHFCSSACMLDFIDTLHTRIQQIEAELEKEHGNSPDA